MLPATEVIEIERLLAVGNLSQRQIARLRGVSRATVAQIASGARRETFSDPDALPPPMRCRSCGALVYPPCRLCRLRTVIQRAARRNRRSA
jgi:hypothetical protein